MWTIVRKSSILDVAAVLNLPLEWNQLFFFTLLSKNDHSWSFPTYAARKNVKVGSISVMMKVQYKTTTCKNLIPSFQTETNLIWVAKQLHEVYFNGSHVRRSQNTDYCVKSIQIRRFFWSVFSRIRTEYGKIRTRKNSVYGHFSRSGYAEVCVID